MRSPPASGTRFLAYGLAGWAVDSLFVFAHTGRRRPSSLLNVPVYGLAQPLFEPVHDRIRHRSLPLRAVIYAIGILGVEYVGGRFFRRFVGDVPWNYDRARLSVDGLVRPDYLPLWAAFGLGLEHLHDVLVGRPGAEAGRAWSRRDRPALPDSKHERGDPQACCTREVAALLDAGRAFI